MADQQSSSSNASSQIIVCLTAPPLWLQPFMERISAFGYIAMDAGSRDYQALNLHRAPSVVLIPLSSAQTVNGLAKTISNFQAGFPDGSVHYLGVYTGRLAFKPGDLEQVGIEGVYLCPFDDEILVNKVCELSPILESHKNLTIEKLVRIGIGDLEAVKSVPFDVFVYLPMNRKTILYLEKDGAIDEKVIKKFRENSHYNLFIRRGDIQPYQQHVRQTIAEFQDGEVLLPMEKAEKIATRISGLLGGFFEEENYSEEEGAQLVENLKSFVTELDDSDGLNKDQVQNITKLASQMMTSRTHGQNVASYCAYFGLACGLTNPQILRMGGLLHDAGMADIPAHLNSKDLKDMTAEEAAKYKQHTIQGVQILSKKNVALPKEVLDMVMFHHEHTDGSGFPSKKKGEEIPPYAKVCAFADAFDKMTSVRPGYPQFSPNEAVERIAGLNGHPPAPIFDPVFHKPIVELFQKSTKKITKKEAVASPAGHGSIKQVEAQITAKVKSVTLGRLLKTDAFAPPSYTPTTSKDDVERARMLSELSAQLTEHFKRAR